MAERKFILVRALLVVSVSLLLAVGSAQTCLRDDCANYKRYRCKNTCNSVCSWIGNRNGVCEPKATESPTDGSIAPVCQEEYAQCGGQDWTGLTCCEDGLICEVVSQFYSQCNEEETPTKAPTTKTPTTKAPTTKTPTKAPTKAPTTKAPTTKTPTTKAPTTKFPTKAPTKAPTTKAPTTKFPTKAPTKTPTTKVPTTKAPTTKSPTDPPVVGPTKDPTKDPTNSPTLSPTRYPTTEGCSNWCLSDTADINKKCTQYMLCLKCPFCSTESPTLTEQSEAPTNAPTVEKDEGGGSSTGVIVGAVSAVTFVAAAGFMYKRQKDKSVEKAQALSEYEMELQKLESEYAWSPKTASEEDRAGGPRSVDHVNPMVPSTSENLMSGRHNSSETFSV